MVSSRFRLPIVRALATVAMLAFANACGSNDTDLTGTGGETPGSSFTATLTGGSLGSYSGLATAVPSAGLFSIGMATADGKFALAFTRNGTRPAVGTYQLGPTTQTGFTAALNLNGGQALYASSSGTLTITASSATEIKGDFSFIATVNGGATPASNVSGSFTAACPVGC